jgi:APA family basic amino acid/polyamine antiporter
MVNFLKREINLFTLIIYGVGIIVGAGIYALIGKATATAGNSVWLSFLFGAILASFTAMSYAELSSMFPKSASEYHYVKNAFNSNIFGNIMCWAEIFVDLMACSTIVLAFGGYFLKFFDLPIVLVSGIFLIILSIVNFAGIKESMKFIIVHTLIEVGGIVLVIVLGLGSIGSVNYFEMPMGLGGVLSASALIFFAFLGFEDIVNVSEETKSPKKTVPKAVILSLLISSFVYFLVSLSVVSMSDWKMISTSDAPLAYAVHEKFNVDISNIISVIALFATAGTALVFLIAGSRMIYGLSDAGELPKIFSKIHPKTRTPYIAILVSMIISMVFVLLGDIKLVASITNFFAFVVFILVNLSAIVLRYRKPETKREFKIPLNIGKFPLLPFFGLLACFLMIYYLEMKSIIIGLLIFGAGIVFLSYLKKTSKK